MALLLIIDTALDTAFVAIANNKNIIDVQINITPQTHASWIHTAIQSLLHKNNINIAHIDYISVTDGPGSYTGLRIGTTTAKGLCFALQKPLIAISNLALIALANKANNVDLYIPMIDARRDEVFTATYNNSFELIQKPTAHIITKDSFEAEQQTKKIIFCGNGAFKIKPFLNQNNSIYSNTSYHIDELFTLTINALLNSNFTHFATFEPNYAKDFYTNQI